MSAMEVIEIPIDKLKPALYNPRRIEQKAFENLQRSIDEFGMPQPLIVNKTTGVLVSGHMRLNAARALGWDKVPVIYIELDEKKEKAFNVVLNNKNAQGEFDTDQLAELLHGLDDEDLILTGFDESELEKLQDGWVAEDEAAADEDKVKVTKYSKEELNEKLTNYRFQEHYPMIKSFLDTL